MRRLLAALLLILLLAGCTSFPKERRLLLGLMATREAIIYGVGAGVGLAVGPWAFLGLPLAWLLGVGVHEAVEHPIAEGYGLKENTGDPSTRGHWTGTWEGWTGPTTP